MLYITSNVSIPKREIQFVYGTSTGPGGQHVNRVATKATLLFDIWNTSSLTPLQQNRIATVLRTRINKAGVLRVASSKYRSQRKNREAACMRFIELLREALKPVRKRRKTKVPRSSKRIRLENKRRRGVLKRTRGQVTSEEP